MIETIPKGKLQKAAIYVNTEKKTMAQIQKELGCSHLMNAGLFNMAKFCAINMLTAGGKTLSRGGNPFGYAIRGDKIVFSYDNNVHYPDFLGAYPVLVRDGKCTGDAAPSGLDGFRPRSCVGVKTDGSVVLLCDQGGRSLGGVAEELVQAGCDTAINLDGGGSTQCKFGGNILTSQRIVHNYLCFWTKPDTDKEKKPLRILLISGHGAADPGAVSTISGKVYREADETRSVTSALVKALEGAAEVRVYDTGRNAYEDYKKGALQAVAQFSKYDYVLEIHFNALRPDAGDGATKGAECYITTGEKSGAVEEAILAKLAALGLEKRCVNRKDLAVIAAAKRAGVSSALLEVCFLDDADDMSVYTKNKPAVAKAIADGIREGFGLQKQELTLQEAKKILAAKAGLSPETIAFLDCYKYAEDLLVKLAGAMR